MSLCLSRPYGNDLQSPEVFGKWYLYVVPEGHFRILELVCWNVPRNLYMLWVFAAEWCIGNCGHLFIPGREEQECGCFLCADSSRVDGVSCC